MESITKTDFLKKNPFLALTGRNYWAWWVISFVIGFVYILVGSFLVGILMYFVAQHYGLDFLSDTPLEALLASFPILWQYLIPNIQFLFFLTAVLLVTLIIHKRRLLSLFTSRRQIDWRMMGRSFGLFFVLFAITSLISYLIFPDNFYWSFNPESFFYLIPLILVFTGIQVLSEEVFFRGYLLQGLGQLVERRWLLILASAVLFLVPHLGNPELTNNSPLVMLDYFMMGGFLTYFVLQDQSLERAFAVHLANNLFLFLIVGYPGAVIVSETMIMTKEVLVVPGLIQSAVMLIAFTYITYFWKKKNQ